MKFSIAKKLELSPGFILHGLWSFCRAARPYEK